jgi:DnaK suppressor protein
MDELTPEQIAELREDLLALEVELAESLVATAEGVKPVDLDEPIGRLSRMEAMQQQKMAEANRARTQSRLRGVKRALVLAGDDYGFCRTCDDPIGFRRLKARPESALCITCQSELESR